MAPVADVERDTSDSWITTKVKADLMFEKGVPGGDISIETLQGVVTLSSDVSITEAQKQVAIRITKGIKGVRDVSANGLKSE